MASACERCELDTSFVFWEGAVLEEVRFQEGVTEVATTVVEGAV